MREFTYVFDEGLRNGLRPFPNIRTTGQYCEVANGLKCYEAGMRYYKPETAHDRGSYVQDPNTAGFPVVSRQAPTVIIDRMDTLAGDSDYRCMVHSSLGWVIGENAQTNDPRIEVRFLPTDRLLEVQIAHFGYFVVVAFPRSDQGTFAFNTEPMIVTPFLPQWERADQAPNPMYNMPEMRSVCNFRAQCVCLPEEDPQSIGYDLSDRHVWTSDIGSIDFDADSRHGSDCVFIPTNGVCTVVKELKDYVIVYTSQDVWALKPSLVGASIAWAKQKVGDVGIATPHAVDGSENTHVIMGLDGEVYTLTNELELTKLGYAEFFPKPKMVKVWYDDYNKDWFLHNYIEPASGEGSTYSYLLNRYGMSRPGARFHGRMRGEDVDTLRGEPIDDITGDAVTAVEVITDVTDLDMSGVKTVHTIDFDVQLESDNIASGAELTPKAGIYSKFSQKDQSFLAGDLTFINEVGTYSVPMAGMEFKFRYSIDIPTYTNPSPPPATINDDTFECMILGMTIRWKMSDMRSVRGLHSPGLRGQSGK